MAVPRTAYADALARLSRRELLNIAWKLGAAAVIQPIVKGTAAAQPALTRYPFTLGVASGDPLSDGIVLWTRLAPDPLNGGGMPMVNVPVRWEIAHDDRFARIAGSGTATARPELGHSVHVEAAGLEAGREYFYRFHAGGDTSIVGRTRTAPAAGAPIDRLRFAVCGCSHFETGYFTAFRHLAAESFDFVFHTGDYIYEGRGNRDRATPSVRLHLGDEIYTVVDYRNRYAQYKSDPDLLKAHASAPFIVSWDDHEVDNDYAGDLDERDTPPEVFLLRRAAAYQAYFESMPLRTPAIPRGPSMTLYRGLAFGNLLDLSVLDTRQYRSDQACGFGAAKDCAAASRTDRTMLGAEQEAWLFGRLPQVRATWTVLGQQVPSFARDSGPQATGQRFSMDKWDGYSAGRQRLFTRLLETRASNPIVLSGDVHVHYGADLRVDFADEKSPVVGTEFTNTAVTSGGDGTDVSGNWENLQRYNPHIKFHSNRRGYIACTATHRDMRADFMVVDAVTKPDAPVRRAGTLVVESGRKGAMTD